MRLRIVRFYGGFGGNALVRTRLDFANRVDSADTTLRPEKIPPVPVPPLRAKFRYNWNGNGDPLASACIKT